MEMCQFCSETDHSLFDFDKHDRGFWCEMCDGFTYLEKHKNQHKFTMLLETKQKINDPSNAKNKIRFNKRLSPLRYPGGKSKVIEQLYSRLQPDKCRSLYSPFTGGGSFELAMLEAGIVEKVHLNDLDTGIYALWWMIVHMPDELTHRIQTARPTQEDYFQARTKIAEDYRGLDLPEAAWTTLLNNRLAYSGVWKANPLGGRNGCSSSLLSRWNPDDLCKRILHISQLADRITVTQENALEFIEEAYWSDQSTIFLDPPYFQKGEQLYHTFYQEKDHRSLAFLLDTLYYGCPGADLLLTYDYCEWIKNQYAWPDMESFGRAYSV